MILERKLNTNHVFDGYNNKSNIVNIVNVKMSARDYFVGDVFSVTNIGHNIRLHLNPLGFSNINTTGFESSHVLEPKGTNTVLILITVGTTTNDKNINMLFSSRK